jgi:hypothetical protein
MQLEFSAAKTASRCAHYTGIHGKLRIIENYVVGDIAPSPSIPLPEGEGRKILLGELSEGGAAE